MELKYSNADLIKYMRKNYFTKILISNILATPLSITVALVFVNWQLMPQLTVTDIIIGIIPLLFYIFISIIIFPISFYYLYFIIYIILKRIIKNYRLTTFLLLVVSSILCSISLHTIDGLWKLNLHAETTVITFITSIIINAFLVFQSKVDCNITKLKSFYYSQLVISLLVFIFSFQSLEQVFTSKPLFQRGTYYQNIRIPLLATGNNDHYGFAPSLQQDWQFDLNAFTHETGVPSNDVISINRIGYYNTGMCIQAKLNKKALQLYKDTFPPYQLESIKPGTCFRTSDKELYTPRDFQGKLIRLTSNKLWGKQKFILIDSNSCTVSYLLL